MSTQELVKSRNFKIALGVVGALLVVFASFSSGVAVGLHKAKFSYQWGQNYERNFMGPGKRAGGMMDADDRGQMMGVRRDGGMMDFPRNIEGRDFRNAHGIAGTIISVADNNLIIKDRDNKENTVAVTDRTIIKDHMLDVKISDLKANDQIVVMGRPDDQGIVNADLIRVFCCGESSEITNSNNN
ncbi:MAG: hypothetical protein WAV73_04010 [Candidatus Moraniibacteriota bacterium]